ncbi:MAG TPA: invasin domain 3-containing protein [Gemmata sp.]|nr:invasin domain 3-containing protein [Gemmata sp.]
MHSWFAANGIPLSEGQGTFSLVTDNHNGTYTATFKGTVAGNNTISATLDGQKVTSTAVSITVI